MAQLKNDHWFFLLMVGLFATAPAIALNVYGPAIPAMADGMGVPVQTVQLAPGVFMAGFGVGMALFGPLSDGFGRRPVILACALSYAAVCAIGLVNDNYAAFLMAAALQGFFAGGASIIARVILRDHFQGPVLAAKMSVILAVINSGPIVGPLVVAWLLGVGGWHAPFLLSALYGLMLVAMALTLLGESHTSAVRSQAHPVNIAKSFAAVLQYRNPAIYSLINGCAYSAFAMFFATLSPIVIVDYGASADEAAMVLACVACGAVVGSLANARLVRMFSLHGVVRVGAAIAFGASAIGVGIDMMDVLPLPVFVACLFVLVFGTSLIIPTATSLAIACKKNPPGVTTSVLGVVQALLAAIATSLIVLVHNHTAGTALVAMGTLALISGLLLFLILDKSRIEANATGLDRPDLAPANAHRV